MTNRRRITFTFSTQSVVIEVMRDLVTPGAFKALRACSDDSISAMTDMILRVSSWELLYCQGYFYQDGSEGCLAEDHALKSGTQWMIFVQATVKSGYSKFAS